MFYNVYFAYFLLLLNAHMIYSEDENCSEIPEFLLEEILGPAYNSRYMSIDLPMEQSGKNLAGKRGSEYNLDFYVDDVLLEEDQPAWEITSHVEKSKVKLRERLKRNADYMQEWHCKSRLKWTDLGPDYFPRYLRSVDCLTESCWFKIYKCRPRSFTVKLLRRKHKCVLPKPGIRIGANGLPQELKQLWVWEERPVNFCCDCSI